MARAPAGFVAVFATGLCAFPQDRPERRIAELIGRLEEGRGWQAAMTALIATGSPAAIPLAQALSVDLDEEPEAQAWKLRVLDTLRFMGAEGAPATETLYETLGRLPPSLVSPALRAFAEVVPYSGLHVEITGMSPDRDTVGIRLGDERRSVMGQGASEFPEAVQVLALRGNQRIWANDVATVGAGLRAGPLGQDVGRVVRYDAGSEVLLESLERRGLASDEITSILETLLSQRGRRRPSPPTGYLSEPRMQLLKLARFLLGMSSDDSATALAYGCILTEHFDPVVRTDAAMQIGRLLAGGAPALPDLVAATEDLDPRVVAEAITALGMVGTEAKEAVPVLEKLIGHEDAQISERAKAALRQIRGGSRGS